MTALEDTPLVLFVEGKTDPPGMESECPTCRADGGCWCVIIGTVVGGKGSGGGGYYRVGGLHQSRLHRHEGYAVADMKLAESVGGPKPRCATCGIEFRPGMNPEMCDETHEDKAVGDPACEDCGAHIAAYRCEKGSAVCPSCASVHRRDGHVVYGLETGVPE